MRHHRLHLSLCVFIAACGDNIGAGDDGPTDPTFCDLNPGVFEDPNACEADGSCPAPGDIELSIQPSQTLATAIDDNPEIIKMIPNTPNRAV